MTTSSRTKNSALELNALLSDHPEYDLIKYDLQLLFGEDLLLEASDLSRFSAGSVQSVSDEFLTPDNATIRGISLILASPSTAQIKFERLKSYLVTGTMDNQVRMDLSDIQSRRRQISASNPVLTLLDLEGTICPQFRKQTLDYLNQVLTTVSMSPEAAGGDPEQCLEFVWRTIKETRVNGVRITTSISQNEATLFSENLNRNALDCDTSSFVILAVAFEMGWPVKLVVGPRHALVHWEGRGYINNGVYTQDLQVNIDTAEDYELLDARQTEAMFHVNIGTYHAFKAKSEATNQARQDELTAAVKSLTRALQLYPQFKIAKHNLQVVQGQLR